MAQATDQERKRIEKEINAEVNRQIKTRFPGIAPVGRVLWLI